MSLFQKSVISKHIKNLNQDKVDIAFEKFQEFYGDRLKLNNIMQLKEENYQEGFLREIFVQTLGYTINPDKYYNLTTEYKNQKDSRKADGAIIRNGKAIGVIELKSTKIRNLESIKEQAFGYKNNQPDCKYVITSNFQSLRFYIGNATEYEEFNLFQLNKEQFTLLYLMLSKESIFSDLPEKLKQETKFHENDISDKLYKDYKQFKNKIFNSLVKNNTGYDKLTLFKKSQKLLDRFLFIFFAEDCGLIPPNTISKIVSDWRQLKKLNYYQPLYNLFKKYFSYLDKGQKIEDWREIPAYNGGLFSKDEILDNSDLIIEDEALEKDSLKISAYDFSTEIDVNILGHIFEHSLNEIEKIETELILDLDASARPSSVKTTSKRKKDGVFYTPKYITKYIVENTVGTLCNEKKEELQISNILIDDSYKQKNGKLNQKGKQLFETLHDYKKWLLTLKILDPACGSGAFLNQTLDFLSDQHKQADDLIAELTGDNIRLFDTDKSILENNIYGVDINEESVEIAKLSLWLRTAQRGRTLSDLSGNIKCGNSLIDVPEVAGDKAFDWEKEFPHVFNPKVTEKKHKKLSKIKPDYLQLIKKRTKEAIAKAEQASKLAKEAVEISQKVYEYTEKIESVQEPEVLYGTNKGGFDVVLGNPPYVRQELINKIDKEFLSKKYEVGSGIADLYVYFYNLAINLTNKKGLIGYITPNKWFKTKYGVNLRNFIKQYNIVEVFDFFELKIFQDASTEPQIIIIRKKQNENSFKYYPVSKTSDFISFSVEPIEIEKNKLKQDSWIFSDKKNDNILNTIYRDTISLKEYSKNGIYRGITTGLNKAFIIDEKTKNKLISDDYKSAELIKKNVTGTEIEKWRLANIEKQYFINTYYDIDISEYPAVHKYLLQFNRELEKRQDKGKTHFNLRACSYYNKFEKPKIIYIHTAVNHNFYFDTESFYINNSCYFISNADTFLACWLNSKIFSFLKQFIFVAYGDASKRGRAKLDYNKMINIPIPKIENNQKQPFIEKADLMLSLNKELQTKSEKFLKRIQSNFEIDKISKKLQTFYNYDFKTFITELKKQKIKIDLKLQDEWEEYFESYKTEINKLQTQINQTDQEIDQMVYQLYELTPEEIKIVEESVK